MTDINSDSDTNLPIITRRDVGCKEKFSFNVKQFESHSVGQRNKSDSLSTTDINSDDALPDIDNKSYTDEIDGTAFGENNNKRTSVNIYTISQDVTKTVSSEVLMQKSNNHFTSPNLDSCSMDIFSKMPLPTENTSVPVEISDCSNDSNSNIHIPVSERLDFHGSLLERCKLKTNVDKVFDNRIISKSNEMCSDVRELVADCDVLSDVDIPSDSESYVNDNYAEPCVQIVPDLPTQNKKTIKRRTPEEIAENRRQAEVIPEL